LRPLDRCEEENGAASRLSTGIIYSFGYLNLHFTSMIKGRDGPRYMTFRNRLIMGFGAALCVLMLIGALSYQRFLQEDFDQKWVVLVDSERDSARS
jgi:hypothetical protein